MEFKSQELSSYSPALPFRSLPRPSSSSTTISTISTSTANKVNNDDDLGVQSVLYPPDNFSMVASGVYRSGFPEKKNFPFLTQLGLKTIIFMCPEAYPKANLDHLTTMGGTLHQCGVAGNKEPFVDIPADRITEALKVVCDPSRRPLLIHCNKGKHRTGCLVGCLRKLQGWTMSAAFEEYRRFSEPKDRFMDQQFIELWDPSDVLAVVKGENIPF